MNSPRTSDQVEAASLEKLRDQLTSDMEAMQEREACLRDYERRLRLLVEQAQAQPARPMAPYAAAGAADLDTAWEKYHRAYALLEAARRGLSDDRLACKAREQDLQIREQEVGRREAWVKVREQELAAKAMPRPGKTRTAFAAARSLLSAGKPAA